MKYSVEWHDELASTNTFLRERARASVLLPAGTVVAAHVQTAGRGRGARSWIAARGENLTFSLLLRPHADRLRLASLPMAAALAAADLLAANGTAPQLKWPNDVLAGGRKLCGILQEALADGAVVLGVGMNVNMSAQSARRILPPATSLRCETGRAFDLEKLLGEWLAHFDARFAAWSHGGFSALRGDWERLAQAPGTAGSRGVIAGYGERGELLVRTADGRLESVWSD